MKNKNELEESDVDIIEDNYIIADTKQNHIFTVYLDGDIKIPEYYRNIIHLLNSAGDEDEVIFKISSQGGDLSSGVMLANAIMGSKARTKAVVETYACSAASLIPLVTDEVAMMPHSFMMIHSVIFGSFDEMQKMKTYMDFQNERLLSLLKDFYEGFLTNSEIDDVVNHSKELWLTDTQVMDRLKMRDEVFGKEIADAIEELKDVYTPSGEGNKHSVEGERKANFPSPLPAFCHTGIVVKWEEESAIPEEWLPCDGRVLFIDEYPDLFESIGHKYTSKKLMYDDFYDTFCIPNVKGFIIKTNTTYQGGI